MTIEQKIREKILNAIDELDGVNTTDIIGVLLSTGGLLAKQKLGMGTALIELAIQMVIVSDNNEEAIHAAITTVMAKQAFLDSNPKIKGSIERALNPEKKKAN